MLLRESVQNQSERAPRYLAVCNDLFVNIGVIDGIMRSAYLLPRQIFTGFDILQSEGGDLRDFFCVTTPRNHLKWKASFIKLGIFIIFILFYIFSKVRTPHNTK